ncbi:GNAT family N-acetyltransferase [Ancylomarina euxinus]|uniref:GNAT family N-acetyltransferase n=1 Tax=Ancylomarina euxinus TaxID=2283627 RepID=A0A425Y8C4_9BACT|nr:GNAT family N-acetyltransferase [Ancylomarina euxinus]MCZ4693394.1 GNAT family N-acetyltransferase [Ancylomarina euxinus]MUP13621.1 GNAT family N-acetyltransferase [Ancylomarina euxinus]RRG24736.1 GNAT family N-acetyltransferase [Ancylomarina euxinus]
MIYKILSESNDPDFNEALSIYHEAFPPEEQQSTESLLGRIVSPQGQFIVAKENGNVLAMAILWNLSNSTFTLLEYFAVRQSYQGSGLGTNFLKHLVEIVGVQKQALVAELENPLLGSNTTQRQQRMKFYIRNKFKQIQGLKSYVPSLNGTETTEVILMVNTPQKIESYKHQEITQMILSIFTELYRVPESDLLLQQILSEIPEQCSID